MQWYRVNFKKLALRLLPTMFQNSYTLSGFLYALMRPIGVLHNDFMNFRREKLKRLSYNGQVCSLQAMLNDYFDNTGERSISVEDPSDAESAFLIYKRIYVKRDSGKLKQVFSHNDNVIDSETKIKLINPRAYSGVCAYDFVVKTNMSLTPDDVNELLPVMRKRIDTFKLTSKRYQIKYASA